MPSDSGPDKQKIKETVIYKIFYWFFLSIGFTFLALYKFYYYIYSLAYYIYDYESYKTWQENITKNQLNTQTEEQSHAAILQHSVRRKLSTRPGFS